MIRPISVSEIGTALDCLARWDFSYGDHLAGTSLTSKRTAPILSGGRAWGAALAAWHGAVEHHPFPLALAEVALSESLTADAKQQREAGVYDEVGHGELETQLMKVLDHYTATAERFQIETPEREFLVPIPSRTGRQASSRYRLLAYVDGIREWEGGHWIVEFKLRGKLTSVEQIARSRQLRWYAWAYRRETGIPIVGALTVERWNQPPKEPRLVQAKPPKKDRETGEVITPAVLRPSHAVDQLCLPADYVDLCYQYDDVEPHEETVAALEARRWQQVVPIRFREGELEEAGRELVTAARLIQQLDSGRLLPLRNAKPQNCNGCRFNEICAAPDPDLVDALFERKPPKRLREPEEAAA